MTNSPPYNVLIIGAGQIGAFYDSPKGSAVLSHAHAFKKNDRFNLLGFMDIDDTKAKKAAKRWGVGSFESLNAVLEQYTLDVVVIATPEESHSDLLMELSLLPIKLLIVEKPLATSIQDSRNLLAHFKDRSPTVLVNYSRRFIPEYWQLRSSIEKGSYGQFMTGTASYGKGLSHNGSHVLDQLMMLLGPLQVTSVLGSIADFGIGDLSTSAILTTQNKGQVYLQTLDSRVLTHYELDLIFEKARLRITNLGRTIETYHLINDPDYSEHKTLQLQSTINVDLSNALINAVDHALDLLQEQAKPLSSLSNAHSILELCKAIQNQASSTINTD